MKNRDIMVLIFTCLMLMLFTTASTAQKAAKEKRITIQSVVRDEQGKPVEGAVIYGNEGAQVVKTDATGSFSISVPEQTDLLIEADGFGSALFKSAEIRNMTEFTLKPVSFLYGEKDEVNIAFGKVKRGDLVNAVSVLKPGEILKYDNIQDITEALNARTSGMLGSSNIRGLGNAMFIVDGLPRDINTLNLTEIEQITVLKDINSSILYGNGAVNGVVLVTTKRGEAYKKQVNVNGFYGISKPRAMPNYLSSADYMELYNEARVNDGLTPLYDAASVANYRSGLNPYRYPDVDYYSDKYLTNIRPFSKVMTEISGGNSVVKYYSNIGLYHWESLLDFGAGKNTGQNEINARGNVDMKINDWIKSAIDATAVLNNAKGPVGNYWSDAATFRPNLFAPLLPIWLIDPNNALLKGRKNDVDGMYILGGTSTYQTNPIANGFSGGENENIARTFSFNNRIDFNLGQLTEGLAFHTNISFDFRTSYDQSINNTYSVYLPVWSDTDSIKSLTKYGTDTRTGSQNVSNSLFQRRFGFYAMFDYDRTFGDVHHVTGSLLGYGNRYKIQGDFQGSKNVNLGLRLAYVNNEKYMIDFSSAYVSSVKLPEGNRGAFSPSLGLAWVVSKEEFLSSSNVIDYLKLRASAGMMNSDAGIDGFFYYDNRFGGSGSYAWYDGAWSNSGIISNNGGNMGLAFEKRQELNLGFESILFDHSLTIDANIFTSVYKDQITRPQSTYPSYYTNFIPYENFSDNAYRGAEIGITYTRKYGDFSYLVGANALYANSEVLKTDEIYANDYQYRKGKPVDARFGLVSDGFYKDAADIAGHALQVFGTVKPGDIKYKDQNGDGVVDTNDELQIGRWQAPFSYGLSLRLTYKNVTLFAHGNGRSGADGYLSNNYFWVDGDDKYSDFVLNRWTEATKNTATFPRLSAGANNNNFRSTDFWLYKDDYFMLDRVQLTYELPETVSGMLKMKHLSLYIDGSNLLTVSKYKEYRELNIGGEPYYRSFSVGIKTMF